MAETDAFTAFPRTLRASTERPRTVYRRLPELIAIHGPTEPPEGWEVVLVLDDPPIRVCRAPAPRLPATLVHATITPVYALARRGAPAVPTGLVLVRFREGIAATERSGPLSREGFAIRDVLSYSPSAAWVSAISGGILAALRGIPALEALPDVVNVEPQMVMRAARR